MYIPGTAPSSTEGGQKGHVPKPHVPGLPRASLRRASASVQRLKRVVGDSKKLYLGVVINCRVHFAEHGDVGACSLRSQLLMSLHDDEKTGLCGVDRCHRLAWLADACVRDRCLDGRRCAEIVQIIEKSGAGASLELYKLLEHKGQVSAMPASPGPRPVPPSRGIPADRPGESP